MKPNSISLDTPIDKERQGQVIYNEVTSLTDLAHYVDNSTPLTLETVGDSVYAVEDIDKIDLLSPVKQFRRRVGAALTKLPELNELKQQLLKNLENYPSAKEFKNCLDTTMLPSNYTLNVTGPFFKEVNGKLIPNSVFELDTYDYSLDDYKEKTSWFINSWLRKENPKEMPQIFDIREELENLEKYNNYAFASEKQLEKNKKRIEVLNQNLKKLQEKLTYSPNLQKFCELVKIVEDNHKNTFEIISKIEQVKNDILDLVPAHRETLASTIEIPNITTFEFWKDDINAAYQKGVKKYQENKTSTVGSFYARLLASECAPYGENQPDYPNYIVSPEAYLEAILKLKKDRDLYLSEFCNAFGLNKEAILKNAQNKKGSQPGDDNN